jgi:hypothetical protein
MVEGVDAGVVAIRPVYANSVTAHGFDFIHTELGFVHGEQFPAPIIGFLRRRTVSAGASRAGAFITQVSHSVLTVMVILPVDLDTFGF